MYFCNMIFRHLLNMRSHPTWVRGLKRSCLCRRAMRYKVAPYVGAWIETMIARVRCQPSTVAPYVGAWIETPKNSSKRVN